MRIKLFTLSDIIYNLQSSLELEPLNCAQVDAQSYFKLVFCVHLFHDCIIVCSL